MSSRAFYKSRTFWAGVMSIVTGISIIAQTGKIGADAIAAILAGIGAIAGRAGASAPLGWSDKPASESWDPLKGQ
ncbi:MAG TPA: hypothetical protein VMU16_14695 [Candidatus Binataceae bacterium]|nr:hypothetical protein [Candidatus Binataceae bacterium]